MADVVITDEDMPGLHVRCTCYKGHVIDGVAQRSPSCPYCIPVKNSPFGVRPSPFACEILKMLERFQGKVRVT